MEYRELGRTGWKVSTVSFGAWAIGGTWGDVKDDESLAALNRALDLGVNFSHSIVNRHRIELFILDDQGRVVVTFARLQWDVQNVLDRAKILLCSNDGRQKPHREPCGCACSRAEPS